MTSERRPNQRYHSCFSPSTTIPGRPSIDKSASWEQGDPGRRWRNPGVVLDQGEPFGEAEPWPSVTLLKKAGEAVPSTQGSDRILSYLSPVSHPYQLLSPCRPRDSPMTGSTPAQMQSQDPRICSGKSRRRCSLAETNPCRPKGVFTPPNSQMAAHSYVDPRVSGR